MSTYSFPNPPGLLAPSKVELIQVHNNRVFRSQQSGYTQTISLPGARWGFGLTWGVQGQSVRQQIEALVTKLSGMEHRLSLYDISHPTPSGTINLSGVTASAAAQFASSITLNGCGATKTIVAGDWFSVVTAAGVQLLMVADDATSNGSGVMTVNFRHPLRAAVSNGATVVLDHPTGLFILDNPQVAMPRGAAFKSPELSLTFLEVFA